MSRGNIDVIRAVIEAMNRDDGEGAVQRMDPAIRFDHGALQGNVVGHDGVKALFADFVEHFDSWRLWKRSPLRARHLLLVPCGRRGLISQTSRRTATGTVGAEQARGGSTPLRRTIRLSWPADVQSRLLPHPAAITAVTSQRAGCQHQTASRAARLLLQSRRSKAGPVCLLHVSRSYEGVRFHGDRRSASEELAHPMDGRFPEHDL